MSRQRRKAPLLKLVPVNEAQRQDAVVLLEDALARAKAGEIENVGIAYVKRGGAIGSAFSDCLVGPLLGASVLLTHRLAAGCG